ncbi:cytochrome c3 family protein [Neobacillus muris]|uniref:cytochrome c3 family protein n=1 Tax=Neobacillus muris TaxID=2941334 RepID=UPI00203C8CB8|nr:cytochrome c3 family protein [Neobacillus muris]
MSKKKFGFSLFLALIIVGLLSTTAFARGTYWESVKANGTGGFTFGLKNTASVDQTFVVKVFPKDTTANTYTTELYTSPEKVVLAGVQDSIDIPASAGIQVGTIYKMVLYTVKDGVASDVGVKFGVLTSTSNPKMASIADDPDGLLDVDGSGLNNANNTVGKASTHPTHGAFQNNTNTCASCHQTHTAAEGNALLFKDGVYSTCSACHDGTTGAYNSFAPATTETVESIQGTFDVHGTNQNGSMHNADGAVQLSAAPGGNPNATADFDCASCHNAHGSGSAEENNLAVDPAGWGEVPYLESTGTRSTVTIYSGHAMKTFNYDNKTSPNGKLFINIPIYNSVAEATAAGTASKAAGNKPYPYVLVKQTAGTGNSFYSRAGITDENTLVIQTYRWSSSKYVADYSLWLRELSYPFTANTVLYSSDAPTYDNVAAGKPEASSLNLASNLKVVYKDGFAYGADVGNIKSANIALGIDVETDGNIEHLWDGTVPDSGIEMTKYCAACHIDYLSESRNDVSGTYTTAHRHANVSRDELTCVRCHYAHGTEASIMHDANDNSIFDLTASGGAFQGNNQGAIDYLKDPNPSSALKRYTGMSVCYACHGGGESFVGSPRNTEADTSTGEHLKGGMPGEARWDVTN